MMLTNCTTGRELAGQKTFFDSVDLPIGLQVYTLGPEAGNDLDATFASISAIGYKEVELPNLFNRSPTEVRAAADRAGLTISSLHVPLTGMAPGLGLTFSSPLTEITEALSTLGAGWAVSPLCLLPSGFRPRPGEELGDAIARSIAAAGPDIWKRTAALLNEKAAALSAHGIKVGYHNHNLEFAPVESTTGWDILVEETDPSLVYFEVDTGWVATAGLDPVDFIKRHGKRISILHVKDVAADNAQSYTINMSPAEVGSGVLPFEEILPAAYEAGTRHFLVEQEPPFTLPRIEAARKSYEYLAQLRITT